MRRDINDVEIKEPPIREFEKKSSCLKRSCAIGCGCFAILGIGFLFLLRYGGAPRPKELKKIPAALAERIPLYDKKNINRIVLTSPSNRPRLASQAILLPKAISPSLLHIVVPEKKDARGSLRSERTILHRSAWTEFTDRMKEPNAGEPDVYEIEWIDLSAKPQFLQEYYKQAFEKMDFTVANVSIGDKVLQFSFTKENTEGSLYIEDTDGRIGTDEVLLTVRIPGDELENRK